MCVMHAFFVVGAIRVGRKLGTGGCFFVPMGHPWPVPRFIPGASHKKTTPCSKLARVLICIRGRTER